MYCEHCGVYVPEGATMCPECRRPIRQGAQNFNQNTQRNTYVNVPPNANNPAPVQSPQPVTPQRQDSGALTGALVGICVVLVIVLLGLGLVAGGVIHLGVGDGGERTESSASSSSSSNNSSNNSGSGGSSNGSTSSGSSSNTSGGSNGSQPSGTSSSSGSSQSGSSTSSGSTSSSSSGNTSVVQPEPTPTPTPEPAPEPEPSYASGGTGSASLSPTGAINWYVIPDSSTREYSSEELSHYSDWDLYIARNEIYARHGRGFKFQNLRDYFNRCTWYSQVYGADEFDNYHADLISALELRNIKTMLDLEQARGSRYPYGTGNETPW